ncbi:MAG: menaquinone biosynthesis protein [Vicinamibacterales bacterium]|nr:menaquinone biosynthesis protein [Vicinamibacterales bacterium]
MLRLGVVEYLNARPLAFGLDRQPERFSLRFDVPARCAQLLHDGAIDLGTIPSIEYLRGEDLAVVPGVAIGCDGPVASVAIFTRTPLERVATLALDTSSRTSVVLARVLCNRYFGIRPEVRPMAQDPVAMLQACDAAVVIGDAALFFDHDAAGVLKIDLGAAWQAWTGLPFVFAFWAGRPGAVRPGDVPALLAARDAAVHAPETVASAFFGHDSARALRGARYLRDNVTYGFSDRQIEGLVRFYREAASLGFAPAYREPVFY